MPFYDSLVSGGEHCNVVSQYCDFYTLMIFSWIFLVLYDHLVCKKNLFYIYLVLGREH